MVEQPKYEPRDESPETQGYGRRHRQPKDLTRLVLVLSCIVGVLCVSSVGIAVYSIVKLKAQADNSTKSRQVTSEAFCDQLNTIVIASRANANFIADILVKSAQQSRSFEPVLKRLGIPIPPYRDRLAAAEAQRHTLAQLKPKTVNCDGLAGRIERDSAP